MSAYGYPKDVHKVDIETEKYFLDGEHYIKEVHSKIAIDYFGYPKGLENA